MTRPLPTRIPLSSLLPPSSDKDRPGPSQPFPIQSVIFGPLPPSSPLHISLSYLLLMDLDPYESISHVSPNQPSSFLAESRKGKGKERENENEGRTEVRLKCPERVLLVTGSRADFQGELEDDDEDWLRDRGGDIEVLNRLKRVDMRYCPTPSHLRLLLTLLSESTERHSTKSESAQHVHQGTSLVVLYDLASLFMREEEGDENLPPDEVVGESSDKSTVYADVGKRKRFKEGVCLSDYMDILAAARAAVDHLSSLHPSRPPVQLIILEPSLSQQSSLPIMRQLKEEAENEPPRLSRANREKRIAIIDGARWLFGKGAVGIVQPQKDREMEEDTVSTSLALAFDVDNGEVYPIRRKRCGRGEWAVAEVISDSEGAERGKIDEEGGWRWEWRV